MKLDILQYIVECPVHIWHEAFSIAQSDQRIKAFDFQPSTCSTQCMTGALRLTPILFIYIFAQTPSAWGLPPCETSREEIWDACEATWSGPSGAEYSGEWANGKRHGHGIITWADGQKYVGDWDNDRRHGRGTHTRTDGLKYIGEFKNDYPHGQGTWTWTDGQKYVGAFKFGKPEGKGTHVWPDGHQYSGEFLAGLSHGQGTYTWANGRTYVGEWKYDKMDGHGVVTFIDGRIWSGKFRQGEWVDGDKYAPGETPP